MSTLANKIKANEVFHQSLKHATGGNFPALD